MTKNQQKTLSQQWERTFKKTIKATLALKAVYLDAQYSPSVTEETQKEMLKAIDALNNISKRISAQHELGLSL